MKIGQISYKGKQTSKSADYIQLDICGLNREEAIEKYKNYHTTLPVILHGDWKKDVVKKDGSKIKVSENNLRTRKNDYIEIINAFKDITTVLGFTLHPPYRTKMKLDELKEIVKFIENKSKIEVFVENRSNKYLLLSDNNEIIEFSQDNIMTIDIPQLYISSGYDFELLINTLNNINKMNIREIHLANIIKKERNTFVGRKLNDGELDIPRILNTLQDIDPYYTLEILGGINTFDDMYKYMKYEDYRNMD